MPHCLRARRCPFFTKDANFERIEVEKEFKRVKNYFKRFIVGKHFLWDSVYHFVSSYRMELNNDAEMLEFFCEHVIKLLEEFDCSDGYLVSSIFCLYSAAFRLDPECVLRHRKFPSQKQRIANVLQHTQTKPAWYTPLHVNYCCDYRIAASCLWKGDFKFMQLLGRYGVSRFCIEKCAQEKTIAGDTLTRFILQVDFHREIGEGILDNADRRTAGIMAKEMLDYLKSKYIRLVGPGPETFRRMLVIMKGIHAIVLQLEGSVHHSDYVKSLKLYFETTTEPFITAAEMSWYLSWFLSDLKCSVVSKLDLLDKFKALFPETECDYQPRTLKHLSRCKVRETYRQWGSLPVEIGKLCISVTLKAYILCDYDVTTDLKSKIRLKPKYI